MSYSTGSSSRSELSPQKTLELANFHLNHARNTDDPELAVALCDDAEAALFRVKKSVGDRTLREEVAQLYFEHGRLLNELGHGDKAQTSFRISESLRLV